MPRLTKRFAIYAALVTGFGLVVLAACGQDSTPTPSPTPTPVPLISIDPEEDPAAFLQAIPVGERECLEQAVGVEDLEGFISNPDIAPGELQIIQGCLSEDTLRRLTLGLMTLEAGELDGQTVACLQHEAEGVSFLEGLGGEGPGGTVTGVLLVGVMVRCLSDEELVRVGFVGPEDEGGPTAEQLRCVFEQADAETLGTLTEAQVTQAFVQLFLQCGIPLGPDLEGGLPATRGGPGEHPPIQPATHISPGESHPAYSSMPPTSGWHYGAPDGPADWGIYQAPLPDEVTVHNLEHGGVNIFYDTDDQQLVSRLEDLARSQTGFPCWLLVAPYPGMGRTVALTAWGAVQYFDAYDEAAMEEFIDFYRAQGPERVPCAP